MADSKQGNQSVKLRGHVVETARIVAAYRNEPMGDMLSDLLEPVLERMEEEEVKKRSKPKPKGKEPK